MVYNLCVRSLDGRTRVFHIDSSSLTGAEVGAIVTRSCFPADCRVSEFSQFRLLSESREVSGSSILVADDSSRIFPTCTLVARLLGGKGGFGSLLRGAGQAKAKKTTNFDACRDMNGRRMRHVNAEMKLKDWQHEEQERKLEKTAQSYLKNLAKEKKRRHVEVGSLDDLREESAEVMESMATAVRSVVGVKREGKRGEGVDAKGKRKMTAEELEAEEKEQRRVKKGKLIAALEEIEEEDSEEDMEEDDEAENDESEEDEGEEEGSEEEGKGEGGPEVRRGGEKVEKVANGKASDSHQQPTGLSGASSQAVGDAASRVSCIGSGSEAAKQQEIFPSSQPCSGVKEPLAAQEVSEAPVVKQQPTVKQAAGAMAQDCDEHLQAGSMEIEAQAAAAAAPAVDFAATSDIGKGEASGEGVAESPFAAVPVGELDLSQFPSAGALEVVGLDRLKAELQARGLKCGGTLTERGARLFLLTHTPLEKIDAKHVAKPAHGGKKNKK